MDNKKIILYIVIGAILLLLIFSSFGVMRLGGNRGNTGSSGGNVVSGNMPQECQKPEGQDLQSWKEHLGHHQNTLYCLDYYK